VNRRNILENAAVGCRRTPRVVLWLAARRWRQRRLGEVIPAIQARAAETHCLHMHSPVEYRGYHRLEFAIPDQWIAAHDRQM
jgi:hypothetical protein